MSYRYTIDILASGQPRPYADSRYHVRLTIEIFAAHYGLLPEGMERPEPSWQPNDSWKEEEVRALLPHLRCGFITEEPTHGLDSRLDWLRKTEPGVWEFHTTSPFTD